MTRKRVALSLLVSVAAALFVFWIGQNTSWEDMTVPMPPKGDALINPFYATQRFSEKLGASTAWDRTLTIPGAGAVIVASSWHWSLNTTRRVALEQWVESGGRLVVDDRLIDPSNAFEKWSGISVHWPEPETIQAGEQKTDATCRKADQKMIE